MADYKHIVDLDNEIQAQRLSGVLDEQDIPHRIVTRYDTVYAGIFQTQHGWGYLEAPQEYTDEIRELLVDLTSDADDSHEDA
ncbi:MAG: hypothetical protein EA383_08840 [Spirochaetaceae bacterium]|nr:MAG: hypothetical protein EA383_08840 [Spirochaetaceae bacterium]